MCIFFALFSTRNVALQNISRTLATTGLAYVLVFSLMLVVYGSFEIGKKKSKPIIYSMILSVLFTDLAAYFQLSIMNTNINNNPTLKFENLDLLLITLLIQIFVVIGLTYLGNFLYFKLHKPLRTLILYGKDVNQEANVFNFLRRHRKQYSLDQDALIHERDYDEALIESGDYDVVYCLGLSEITLDTVIKACYHYRVSVSFTPSLEDVVKKSATYEVYIDRPLVDIDLKDTNMSKQISKRIFDLIISTIGFLIAIPIGLFVAIAIKLDDGGSIIYKQPRMTKNDRVFDVYKFRTMKENVMNYSSTDGDDRITKVGAVLRRFRIDELPQLLNILKGEMSVVGPRPEMISNVVTYTRELPEFQYRHRVKAGLTGLAQIEGKYNTSPRDKLLLDLIYIENQSLWYDIKILFRTFEIFFKRESTEGFKKSNLD